ncbi:hypothetical protein M441DRAFT_126913 [Trichoderma asperellum CBS 433.97]|uniref:Uncharacterized protein n=1 Tax=Trichoderma asperellum (strain ATCC 204424 / CBS 433.97 / NBRC 101777) TaxID=1042311 RepID=A0A2T3ZP98_TRIA4|nr:hypothetical protein M441DRAFT_126913 [Trichoderma asperellum CBS 433.97]PTB46640.1 hypothetical protein M441DRAFT_126913 [Trichoderma asperellum CBS 433.97]
MARLLFPHLIAFTTAFITLRFIFSQSKAQATKVDENKSPYFEGEWAIPTLEPGFEAEYRQYLHYLDKGPPDFRSEYGMRPGAKVKGWPSKGGIYILYPCLGFELSFLGLDRFRSIPRPSLSEPNATAEEDAHCDKMRQLGAQWWKTEADYRAYRYQPHYMEVIAGWPAGGGVWVFKTSDTKARVRGAAIIHNAFNMEERCKAIEQLGGVFFENPKDCPDLDLP